MRVFCYSLFLQICPFTFAIVDKPQNNYLNATSELEMAIAFKRMPIQLGLNLSLAFAVLGAAAVAIASKQA